MDRFFSFNGYTQRSEYWAVMLIVVIGGFFLGLGIGPMFLFEEVALLGLMLLIAITVAAFWLTLATTARRCRDADISPYWCLVMLVPYVSLVATVVFGILETKSRDAEVFE